jgi:protein pelota
VKILGTDEKLRTLKLKLETEDDMWILYNLLNKGDLVKSKTSRELKTTTSSMRKPMTLTIRVEWAELQPFTSRLRIHGKTVEGPKELDLQGLRHTLNIDLGFEVEILKEKGWEEYELEKVKEASNRTLAVKALIVSIDYDEICIAFMRDYGVEVIVESSLNLPSKREPTGREEALKRVFSEFTNTVYELCKRYNANAVVVAGPGFFKDQFADAVEKRCENINVKIHREGASNGGLPGVYEAIRRDIVLKILEDYEIIEEEKLMNEFLTALSKNEKLVAYTINDVEKAAQAGL